ncbi:MAG: hypothetical protein QMD21_07440 [Candidatus Thermoplasmatota archaeon]|nr:hypothetical protein [Candidatus Thermoplasmatota archaeon]
MKYKEVTVGRSETLPQKEPFTSTKLFHQITVEVCENENVANIVERLHKECQKLLEEAKKNNGYHAEQNNEFKTAAELMKENKNNNTNSAEGKDNGRKLRDTRNRSVKQLLEELKIKSETQANFLRWNEKISYSEWQRLHDYFNSREIQTMARR